MITMLLGPLVSSCSSSDATLSSCSHSSLAKDDVYKYRVRALYSGGGSSWAQTTDTTVLASVPSTLSQPEVTSANGVNTISWVAPASNGSAITGYTVQFSKADASGDYAGFSEVAGLREYNFHHLHALKSYGRRSLQVSSSSNKCCWKHTLGQFLMK